MNDSFMYLLGFSIGILIMVIFFLSIKAFLFIKFYVSMTLENINVFFDRLGNIIKARR